MSRLLTNNRDGDRPRLSAAPLLTVLISLATSAAGEEPAAPKDPLRAEFLKDAQQYSFTLEGETPLQLEPASVMSWASPNDWKGDIFLWTRAGRPEIAGCVLAGPWENGQRPFFHEFHALTTGGFPRQTLSAGRTWELSGPGVVLQPIPDAPPPADTPVARLQQMRTLAREFVARMHFQGSEWELRLLPQPIFRHRRDGQSADRPWLDGGLFTYVLTTGTDVEVLLLIEARRVGEAFQWQYAIARLTNRPAWITHRDQEVWRVDGHTDSATRITVPYTTFPTNYKSLPAPEPQP
jgi:hypothetical protein